MQKKIDNQNLQLLQVSWKILQNTIAGKTLSTVKYVQSRQGFSFVHQTRTSVSRNLGKFCSAECTLHTIGVEIVPKIVLLCCIEYKAGLCILQTTAFISKVTCKKGIIFHQVYELIYEQRLSDSNTFQFSRLEVALSV